MNLSGILVMVPPEHMDACVTSLETLPGVDVHQRDAAAGRIIVTQEAESISAEVEGLKLIKALPNVISADLVYHRFEQDGETVEQLPADVDEFEGLGRAPIPAALKD